MKVRLVLGTALVVVLAGASFAYWRLHDPARACTRALAERRFSDAAEACGSAFERAHDGEFAAAAAMAWLGAGQPDKAWTWANLPECLDRVRARRVRGVVLKIRGDLSGARRELEKALSDALAASRSDEAARAAHALAGLQWERGQYSAAWESLEVSAREAERANDGPALALAELARGDVLRDLGDARRADAYFRKALEDSAPWPNDHLYALLKIGLSERDRGAFALARTHFEKALELAKAAGNEDLIDAMEMNLADNLVKAGDADAAEQHLAQLSPTARSRPNVLRARAEIALLRGDGPTALRLATELVAQPRSSTDWGWELELLRGDAAWLVGDHATAEAAWAESIDRVEALSAAEPQYQGWVVARRRKPYDALFVALANRGEDARAWEVVTRFVLSESLSFDGIDGTDISRALASAESLRADWKQTVSSLAPAGATAEESRDIVVLHEAGGRLWIGRRVHDVPRWIDAGPLETFDPLLHRFLGDPGDAEAAEALGSAIWKAGALGASKEPLFVVSTGRLRGLALAALRVDGRYWFQLRPLARLLTLDRPSKPSSRFTTEVKVAGDPRGDLPAAREEVAWVAARVGARPLLGAAATREAVLSSRGSALLHLSTHAEVGLDGTRLVLSDGELAAQEILRERPFAKLVVLASCASAAGRDAAGSDSLTTAFVRAGSGAVLGTLRTVPDAAAQQLIHAFYEEGGASDPVRALARAQARVEAYQSPSIWSAFVISVGDRVE